MITKTTYQSYLQNLKFTKYSCIIIGLGNEKRNSIDVLNDYIDNLSSTVKCFIVLVQKQHLDKIQSIKSTLHERKIDILEIDYDDNYNLKEDNLAQFIAHISAHQTIHLDVTGIEREHMLIILKMMTDLQKNISASYISAEYDEHKVDEYLEPTNISFFEGSPRLSTPTALVVLPGYELDASKILLNWYKPSQLYIGYGEKPIEEDQNLPERAKIDKLIENYTGNHAITIKEFVYNAADPYETCESILDIIKENDLVKNFNILFASTSTKLSTIGMFLAHYKYNSIQFVTTVSTKRINITKDILNVFQFDMPKLGGQHENN